MSRHLSHILDDEFVYLLAFHRLMTVSPAAWNIPTIQKLIPLLDNYEKDTLVNEHVTPQVFNYT